MIFRQRKLWLWGVIAIVVIIILTIFTAPNSNKLMAGSTYSKEPNGYGAWYEYMSNKGVSVERWKKPFNEITKKDTSIKIAYLQVLPGEVAVNNYLNNKQVQWIGKGNKLVILGAREPATKAPFTSNQSYNKLQIKLQTTRRKEQAKDSIVKDDYGAIVWREKIKQGEIIYVVSPYIAANAYREVADNYEFLAQLVNNSNQIFIDEYIHGYKDIETKKAEKQETLGNYFAKTIWFPLGIQGLLITIITLIFSRGRFGQPQRIKINKVDNSQAYIEALAGVLEKAESTDFVLKTINKDEQLKLQKKLGLGRKLLSTDILVNEWVKQTQQPREYLQQLLQISQQKKHISETDLVKWIQKWQQINQ